MERSVTLRAQIVAGALAGLAGAMLFELFLFVTMLLGGAGPHALTRSLAFVAASLVGPTAYTNPADAALGIVVYVCVAIGWALGYVYLVRSQSYLVTRPLISGIGFGVVVYLFMQIALLAVGQFHPPAAPNDIDKALLAYIVFYAIPVALVAARLLRPSMSSGRA